MKIAEFLLSPVLALIFAPLLAGVVNKTKAWFAGRKGAPVLQLYYDLFRLFAKESVISSTTSRVFRLAPIIIFASTVGASVLLPFLPGLREFGFTGDFILFFYLLGLARFCLILSAMDTGSAFEGMGASREAAFAALAEPIIFVCILTILRTLHTTSLIEAFAMPWEKDWLIYPILAIPMFAVILSENSRIPFDDPNTHLELTMIHEVMILDNSGVDLGLMEYAASIKLWLFSLLFVKVISPLGGAEVWLRICGTAGMLLLTAVAVGVVESVTARCRLRKIPQLLYSAGVVALVAFYLSISNVIRG